MDLLECRRISPNFAWISSNVAGSHQISLECRRISLNLVWISLHIARFVYNVGRVGWLGFWRRKPATRPAGVGSWAQKPVTDRRSGRFGRLPVRVRAGCSGWSGFGLGLTPLFVGKVPFFPHFPPSPLLPRLVFAVSSPYFVFSLSCFTFLVCECLISFLCSSPFDSFLN